MPTYDYHCGPCDLRHEVIKAVDDNVSVFCGKCGMEMKRVFSAINIAFKGSGFYRTDNEM